MGELLEKMAAADVIVLATPVYFYSMCAQLKKFIDRTVPSYMSLSDKEFYYILTAADTEKQNMQYTVDGIRGFTLMCLGNAKEKGIIYGVGLNEKGDAAKSSFLSEAYKAGLSA